MAASIIKLLRFFAGTLFPAFLWLFFTHGYADSKVGFPAPIESWQAEVDGVQVRYHFIDLKGWPDMAYARVEWRAQRCHVYLDIWLLNSRSELVKLALHEVGHCVDSFNLGFDHNGMGWGDCAKNAHDCRPEERYAEAWRDSYLSACGSNLYPLGFPDEEPDICALPDARAVPGDTQVER